MKCCRMAALGLAVVGCSKEESPTGLGDSARSIEDCGHKGIQLWKDGPYWADTNIGAEKPEDYGYYFWWGDTIGYKRVNKTWIASDGSSSGTSFVKGETFGKDMSTLQHEGWCGADGRLSSQHDAAHVHWGGNWRTPTSQELNDLCEKCDWTWKTTDDVKGYVVRGKGDYAFTSIFLPADGHVGFMVGSYLSSDPNPDCNGNYSWSLYFGRGFHNVDNYIRDVAQPVRPVQGGTK